MLSNTPSLHALDARSTPPFLGVTAKNVSRHWQVSLGEQNHPCLRTTGLVASPFHGHCEHPQKGFPSFFLFFLDPSSLFGLISSSRMTTSDEMIPKVPTFPAGRDVQ